MRGAIGNLRAAAETLELHPGAAPDRRARLFAVLAEESDRLGAQIERLERIAAGETGGGGGSAPATLGRLLEALAAAAHAAGLASETEPVDPPAAGDTRISADIEPLVAAAGGLLAELRRDLAVSSCRLSARAAEGQVLVDISWRPPAEEIQRLVDWRSEALELGGLRDGGTSRSGLRGAARELDGEAWFNLDRDGGAARVRILLPGPGTAAGTAE
jgi:DNA polymerase-3 subunit epsilon